MNSTSSDDSISVNDIVELAISWPESMCNKNGTLSANSTEIMDALDDHCSAINGLGDTSKLEYMKAVDERISEVKEQLDHACRLVYTSGGLHVGGFVPIAVAACNIWNPVGLCAIAAGVFGAAHGFHNGGKRAIEDAVTMIKDSSKSIKESTHGNAITRTATTMQPLVKLLKRSFGESAQTAYCCLLGRLNAISKTKRFDLDKIPEVIRELTDTFRSSDFAKHASAWHTPSEELEEKWQASLEKLKTIVAKSAFTKGESRSISSNVDEFMDLFTRVVDYKNGSSKDKLQSRMKVVELAKGMWKAFLSLRTFQTIELCVSIKSELKPFNDILVDLRRDHREFAESVQHMPKKVTYYKLVGK